MVGVERLVMVAITSAEVRVVDLVGIDMWLLMQSMLSLPELFVVLPQSVLVLQVTTQSVRDS